MIRSSIKKLIWNLTGGYQPKKFWNSWSETFMDDPWQVAVHPQHEWILNLVKKQKPKTILEVGCGFGRNIRFLIENGVDPKKIIGTDISDLMIKKARKYIHSKEVRLIEADAANLPFKDGEFDLIVYHGVFMHIQPENIEKAILEAKRVGRYIIGVEQNYGGNEYTFIHDYKKIFRRYSLELLEYDHNKKIGLDLFYVKVR